MYTEQRVLSTEQRVLYTEQRVLYTEQRVLYTEQRVLSTEQRVLYTEQRVLYTEQRVLSTEQRVSLVSNVIDILQKHNLTKLANGTELYLYGCKTVSVHDILFSTIRYIRYPKNFVELTTPPFWRTQPIFLAYS